MDIRISVEGAKPQEIARGIAAAMAVFERHSITPERAADARFNVEGWDIQGFTGDISAEDLEICSVWDDADQAALKACCADWRKRRMPTSANLELVDPHRSSRGTEVQWMRWSEQS